jgi:hypothetical protein
VLDDDEAVFGVLKDGDQEAADETEDEDASLRNRVVKKYNESGAVSPQDKLTQG